MRAIPEKIAKDTSTNNKLVLSGEPRGTLRPYYENLRPEVLALVPIKARRVLDVGCGAGSLSAAIKSRQAAEVHGVEPVAEAAQRAYAHVDQLWNCSIEEALPKLPDSSYDCIIAADVLEHLVDPWEVLRSLVRKLGPGGQVVASIPNVQNWGVVSELVQGRWDYKAEGILDRTHLRFFTRKTAKELFWESGLRIVSLSSTQNGPDIPEALRKNLSLSGMLTDGIVEDARTWQYLIVGEPYSNPSRPPRVGVIILSWNGRDDTLECIKSVQGLAYSNYEVIVVDNGSSDDSVACIERLYPGVHLIKTGKNLGYAGGNNIGIKAALARGAEYVLVLNNDAIVDPEILTAFIRASRICPEACAFSGKIFYHDMSNKLYYAGAAWDSEHLWFSHLGQRTIDNGFDFSRMCETAYASGCVFFVAAERFREIGFFDERFFLYFEETDWCYRGARMGFRSVYVPEALAWHKASSAVGGTQSPLYWYFLVRNGFAWARRHLSPISFGAYKRQRWKELRKRIFPAWRVSHQEGLGFKRWLWAGASFWRQLRSNVQDPTNRAVIYGFRDYYLGRTGDCPEIIRHLQQRS